MMFIVTRFVMAPKHILFVLFSLANPVAGHALSTSDCAQIQAIYGVTPSKCSAIAAQPFQLGTPGGATPVMVAPRPIVPISEPTLNMRQSNVFFTQSGAELDSTALLQLQRLADLLNAPAMQNVCLKLTGHSDSSGSNLVNLEIGAKRAAAVKNRLALLLRNPARIEVVQSMGEDIPLPGLDGNSVWQRRVTLWARDCPGS